MDTEETAFIERMLERSRRALEGDVARRIARAESIASLCAHHKSLGGQFVLNFGRKNQLAILLLGEENFLILVCCRNSGELLFFV
ncbi:MAG: hypothetical protein AAB461_03310 [Patescibacteria group bacterium]